MRPQTTACGKVVGSELASTAHSDISERTQDRRGSQDDRHRQVPLLHVLHDRHRDAGSENEAE